MNPSNTPKAIESGKTALGIEFGSTRIKAVLIGTDHSPIASGSYDWENRYESGVWTYHLEDVWTGFAGKLPAAPQRRSVQIQRPTQDRRRHRL
jgi:sugar (pentulose or hexulose) kinase